MVELNQQRSKLKSILIAFMIMWVLLLAFNIYLAVTKKVNFALIAVAISLISTLAPLLSSLSKINTEIKLRNANA